MELRPLLYLVLVVIEKEAFGSPSTKVTNFTFNPLYLFSFLCIWANKISCLISLLNCLRLFFIFIYIIHLHCCIGMGPLGSWGVSGLATSDPLTQMTQLALMLLQLPSRHLICVSTQEKKMTAEMALFIILQQPIRAKLFR